MLSTELRHTRIYRAVAVCLVLITFGPSVAEAGKKKVTLPNGETYEVKTKRGEPFPFESDQIRVENLGYRTSFKFGEDDQWSIWSFTAQLKAEGSFQVNVTTPMDKTISTTFGCTGPGDISEEFFDSANYPTVWEWFNESGTSWIPFVFSFEEKQTGESFEITQWLQFDSRAKEDHHELVKMMKRKDMSEP